ncbi:MAG: branched-chain amino acid transport system substrate-binding protein [Actinomycetota bacterium]|nr:Extracellular ligand-binding receptor [Cryptosporangiaceae bacterium]MDQ1678990.1 branched-chain amino acid transport system substrate-binding protein [Actinomycetota bacterium]
MRFQRMARMTVTAAVVALAAAGCGSSDGSGGSGDAGSCKYQIGYFGALTGDSANLGINIRNGAKLAIDQYNKDAKDCVGLKEFDSAGDPAQAPGLARKAVTDKTVLGIIGPAFSGESKAANGTFDQGKLPIITASATNPALADNGWKIFHRILGNDASQGPAAARYIKDVMKAPKVFVVDDATEYGKGLATIVKSDLGSAVIGTDTVQAKQTDFAATVTKIKASGAKAFFYGGYYAEGGLLRKQLTDAGGKDIVMVAADGVKDPGFVKAAGQAAAEGTILTCPCLPPSKTKGTFAADYKAAFKVDAGTYSGEAFDAATVFIEGIKAGKTTREALNDFIGSFHGEGVTKSIAFDAKGEVTDKVIWAYKVKAGQIVEEQEIK